MLNTVTIGDIGEAQAIALLLKSKFQFLNHLQTMFVMI